MQLGRALIPKRLEMRILAAAMVQAVEILTSENVGVVSAASGKRWADSLARSFGSDGVGKSLAWTLGMKAAARYFKLGPLPEALDLPEPDLSSLFDPNSKPDPNALRQAVLSLVWNALPGAETARLLREVAFFDGNLLFHDPGHYVRESRKALDEVVGALPVGLGALALAAEALLNGSEPTPARREGKQPPG